MAEKVQEQYNPGVFVSAIIAAAGRGARLGAASPKQLLTLGDRTILQRSFDIVDRHDGIHEIVIALPPDLASSPPPFLISSSKSVRIVDGGLRRQDSVANAFAQISDRADVIVIHDAARPFASADLFSRVIDAAARGGAAIAGAPGERHREGGDGGARRADRGAHDSARVDLSGADPAGVHARRPA